MLTVKNLSLPGVKLIQPNVFCDSRGVFLESYNETKYLEIGISDVFMQDNQSYSIKNTIRGLHYQSYPGQSKLVSVLSGKIFDVIVDIKPQSPTYKQWLGIELNDILRQQLYIPIGYAHGFCALENSHVTYKVSYPYSAEHEKTILWNDSDINIDWPIKLPILSYRDLEGKKLVELLNGT